MHEVSTTGARMLVRQLELRGVDVAPLLHSAGLTEEQLQQAHWMAWDNWAELLEQAAAVLGGTPALEALAESLGTEARIHRFEWVAQLFSSPERLYELNSRWGVRSQFRHMSSECIRRADGKLEIKTSMPERYRGCEAAFHQAVGIVRCLPQLIGMPASRIVEREVGSHFMRVVLVPPRSRTLWQRARRGLDAFRGIESIFAQLSQQERELFDKTERLEAQLEAQRRVEAALRESEERWRALAQSAPGNILLLAPDGRIRSASAAFEGVAPDALVGRSLLDWAPEAQRARLRALLDGVSAEGELCDLDWVMDAGTPKARWYSCRVGPVVAEGVLIAKTAFVTDTTARELAQRTLQQRESELHQAQKMESLGRLVGSVAHDFNNLLTVVIASADLLREKQELSQDSQLELDEIRHAGQRAADLTRQLLAFTRQQVVSPEVLDPVQVVAGLSRLLERLLGEDIALELSLEGALCVRMDRGQLEQVLINLAANARDAMPRGGTLKVGVRLEELPEGGPEGLPPGKYVRLSVQDSGEGMDAATSSRIFEPFFSTKARGLGTGLGLAIVRGVVTGSGGAIEVSSQVGVGTHFKVLLPLCHEAPTPKSNTEALRPAGGGETILLVEDDGQVRRLARDILQGYGYRVLEATRPPNAFELAEQNQVQLLLTDVVLPEVTGPQLARALAQQHPNLRVLFMSGYAEEEIAHRGIVQPGIDLLTKPFEPWVLAQRVRKALDRTKRTTTEESA